MDVHGDPAPAAAARRKHPHVERVADLRQRRRVGLELGQVVDPLLGEEVAVGHHRGLDLAVVPFRRRVGGRGEQAERDEREQQTSHMSDSWESGELMPRLSRGALKDQSKAFRILGPLEVEGAGPLGGPRPRALLLTLLLAPNRTVSPERLIDAMWPDDPPESARHALQVYLSSLRKAIGADRILTEPVGYRIVVAEDELDSLAFRRHVQDGELAAALALWRGPIESTDPAAAELESLRVTTQEDQFDAAPDIPALERHTREHPRRERGHRQLMLALYRAGRQADALAAYQAARRALDEVGLEPSEELRRARGRDPAPRSEAGRPREAPRAGDAADRPPPRGRGGQGAAARGAARHPDRARRRGEDSDRAGSGAHVGLSLRRPGAGPRFGTRPRPHRDRAGRRARPPPARQLRARRRGGTGGLRPVAGHAGPALPGHEPERAAALRRAPLRRRAARAVGRGRAAVRRPRSRRRGADRAGDEVAAVCESLDRLPLALELVAARAPMRDLPPASGPSPARSPGVSTCSTSDCAPASSRWRRSRAAGTTRRPPQSRTRPRVILPHSPRTA